MVHVVSLDNVKEIIDDSRSSNRSLIVTVVVKEAVDEDMLEGLTLNSIVLLKRESLLRLVSCIPWKEG